MIIVTKLFVRYSEQKVSLRIVRRNLSPGFYLRVALAGLIVIIALARDFRAARPYILARISLQIYRGPRKIWKLVLLHHRDEIFSLSALRFSLLLLVLLVTPFGRLSDTRCECDARGFRIYTCMMRMIARLHRVCLFMFMARCPTEWAEEEEEEEKRNFLLELQLLLFTRRYTRGGKMIIIIIMLQKYKSLINLHRKLWLSGGKGEF